MKLIIRIKNKIVIIIFKIFLKNLFLLLIIGFREIKFFVNFMDNWKYISFSDYIIKKIKWLK